MQRQVQVAGPHAEGGWRAVFQSRELPGVRFQSRELPGVRFQLPGFFIQLKQWIIVKTRESGSWTGFSAPAAQFFFSEEGL